MQTAERLVPELSSFDVEIAIEKLKRHRSSGIDQIPADLIRAGGKHILRSTNLLIRFGIRKHWHNSQKEFVIVPAYTSGYSD
jgi:Holliday junction resolvasome RuvABC ATP-dependent DNA helicase subunit